MKSIQTLVQIVTVLVLLTKMNQVNIVIVFNSSFNRIDLILYINYLPSRSITIL